MQIGRQHGATIIENQPNIALESIRSSTTQPRSVRVLVVEDNKLIREMLRAQLTKAGARVRTAIEGRQALLALASEAFDIVLMDINMPVMDGLETARAIRLNPQKYLDPIIIALTATEDNQAREACFEAGMNDFLCKPVFYPVLIESLSAWCKKLSC